MQQRREVIQTGAFALHRVPDVAVEIVVPGEKQPARLGEGDGGDAADDVVVAVHGQLLVGADVEHAACRVVGACRECEPGREELGSSGRIVTINSILSNI